MSKIQRFGQKPDPNAFFSASERNRIILFSVLLVVVLIAFIGALPRGEKYDDPAAGVLPGEEVFVEEIVLPEFDQSLVAGKVADTRPEDRVLLESGPFDALFRFAREYGDPYFRAHPRRVLDDVAYEELLASPAEHRAAIFRARGHVEELRTRVRPDGLREHRGRLRLESGRVAHFAVHELADRIIDEDFVRVDGMFLKLHEAEGTKGWEHGPFLVGARAVRSFPRVELDDPEELAEALRKVTDDDIQDVSMLEDQNFDAHWMLMAFALDLQPEDVDWSAAEELDNELLTDLYKAGTRLRGVPIRLPVSRNLRSWTFDPGENPARIDRATEGWIGNTTWTAQTGLVRYVMPYPAPELERARYISGNGFFLKLLAYEPHRGGMNVVPYLVMTSVQEFVPRENRLVQYVLYSMLGITLLLALLIPLLLLRDKRKSLQLQRELARRRQERRQRAGQASP